MRSCMLLSAAERRHDSHRVSGAEFLPTRSPTAPLPFTPSRQPMPPIQPVKKAPEISPVMHELATYVSRAGKKPLPKPVVEKTKHHVVDTIAAMVSGSKLLPGEQAISFVKTQGGAAEALVIGSRIVTS